MLVVTPIHRVQMKSVTQEEINNLAQEALLTGKPIKVLPDDEDGYATVKYQVGDESVYVSYDAQGIYRITVGVSLIAYVEGRVE